ncbi:hypothetical protein NW844_11140, partial [Synechococcus sp. H55.2]|uniref:hypothetical protein n=1 Tax=unclassified Synechococcus TaxID=2626047 RepID=UPI0039C46DFE
YVSISSVGGAPLQVFIAYIQNQLGVLDPTFWWLSVLSKSYQFVRWPSSVPSVQKVGFQSIYLLATKSKL